MKNFLRTMLFPLLLSCAQVTGQNISNYSFQASSGTWTDLTGATTKGLSTGSLDDGVYADIPIGFDFTYLGTTYNKCGATTNGAVFFEPTVDAYGKDPYIHDTRLIVPLGDDLTMHTGNLSYKTEVVGSDQVFTIQWKNVGWNYMATAPCISFQVKMYKNSGKIEFCYEQGAGILSSAAAFIGILKESGSGNTYLSLSDATASPGVSSAIPYNISAKPATGQVYAFTPTPTFAKTMLSAFATSANLDGKMDNWVKGYRAEVVVSKSSNPVPSAPGTSHFLASSAEAGYHFQVTGLDTTTKYYYRTYVVTPGMITYLSDQDSFVTTGATAPVVATGIPMAESVRALLQGNIVSDGGRAITSSGFIYSTSRNPVPAGPGVSTVTTTPVATSGSFSVMVSSLVPYTKYYFKAFAVNGSGTAYSAQDSFIATDPVTSFPYSENFDGATAAAWTTAAKGAGVNDWQLGTPAKPLGFNSAYSAPKAWATNLTGAYRNNHDASVISPVFDFSGMTQQPVLEFRHKFASENSYDGGIIEVSVNNGPWSQLNPSEGSGTYTSTATSAQWYSVTGIFGGVFGVVPMFSNMSSAYIGHTNGWILTRTQLSGLAGQGHVRFRFRFASDNSGTGQGWMIDDIKVYESFAPVVVQSPASDISFSGATLYGNITSAGGIVSENGFVLSTSKDPVLSGPGVIEVRSAKMITGGKFSSILTILSYPAKYYYRAFAINAAGVSYSVQDSFVTVDLPRVAIRSAAASYSGSTGSMYGRVEYSGTNPVTASGVVFSTTSKIPAIGAPGVADSATSPVISSGIMNKTVSGLMHSTKYYYRIYATNANGTSYSAPDSFTTLFPPTLITDGAGLVTDSQAVLKGQIISSGSDWITSSGFVVSTATNPVVAAPGVMTINTAPVIVFGNFTDTAQGLSSGTRYYFRAFATSSIGTSYGELDSFTTTGATVPVTWLSFNAQRLQQDVKLTWSTASETDNAGFEIERSVDGRSFKTAGFVKGGGTVSRLSKYSFTDMGAFAEAGSTTLYYRLRQIDHSGRESFSAVMSVSMMEKNIAGSVSPNPFTDQLVITLSSPAASVPVMISDITGKQVLSAIYDTQNRQLVLGDLGNVKPGIYYLVVGSGEGKQAYKIIKQ
jgi:hypothetical protein